MKKKNKIKENFGLYEKVGNLKSILILNVTSRGDSLCVIIPKEIVDVVSLISGDKVRVWFLDHYRKRRDEEEEDEEFGDQRNI